jgi:diguanylate cyclase (GGDEF)-like protein
MKVVNVELYSLLFLVALFIDYYNRFKYRLNKSSYQFLYSLICIIVLAVLNISLATIDMSSLVRYLILIIAAYFMLLLPAVFYCYVEENFWLSKYYAFYSKYLRTIYLFYIPISVIIVFLSRIKYLETPLTINAYSGYNLLLILSAVPLLILFFEFLYYLIFKKEVKDLRMFFIIVFCLLGAIVQIHLPDYYLLTPVYVLASFLLYEYKHETLSDRDVLTGLHNREIISKLEHNRRHNGKELVAYLIDVNKFKMINDTYGHDKGDKVLKDVVKVLLTSVRRTDYVVRFGGDEFVIIAFFDDAANAPVIPTKIKDNLEKHNKLRKIKISVSIGYEVLKPDKKGRYNIYKALEKADQKMYEEKRRGA